ncbi:hypothetical protein [Arsenophonus endosymbiont of Crataerina pallida]|uniref:hypothetical protein n=1 Tax=Arsenophonus endosymbiont of Crataerina pallida TaxID=3066235 RepID=UPI0030D05F50
MSDQKQSPSENNTQSSNAGKTTPEQGAKDFTTKRMVVGDSAKNIKKSNKSLQILSLIILE